MTLSRGGQPAAAAMAFLSQYGGVLGIVDPARELVDEASSAAAPVFASVTQVEGGTHVSGSRLSVLFDATGRVSSVIGTFVPHLYGFSTAPSLSAPQAEAYARTDLLGQVPTTLRTQSQVTAAPSELVIYPWADSPALAYSMWLSADASAPAGPFSKSMYYVVDARSGRVLQASPGQTDVVSVPGSGLGELGASRGFTVQESDGGPAGRYQLRSSGGSAQVYVTVPAQGTPGRLGRQVTSGGSAGAWLRSRGSFVLSASRCARQGGSLARRPGRVRRGAAPIARLQCSLRQATGSCPPSAALVVASSGVRAPLSRS